MSEVMKNMEAFEKIRREFPEIPELCSDLKIFMPIDGIPVVECRFNLSKEKNEKNG